MVLNNKLAFEVWVGIVVLVAVVGGVAGVTLVLDNDTVSSLTRTQANSSAVSSIPSVSPFISQDEITNAALGIVGALSGGAQP